MSGEEVSDAEFRATFSLLPHILKLCKALNSGNVDPQQQKQLVQTTIGELQAQLRLCHQLLTECAFLDHTPEEQKKLLERQRESLKQKCQLLQKYKEFNVLSSQAPPQR